MAGRRILFLASGNDVPSTRYRILPYLPRLRERGYRCDLALSYPPKYDYFPRIGWRASQALKRAVRRWHLLRARLHRYDTIVLERELFDDRTWDLERRFRRAAPRLVLDLDDAVFLRYPEKFAQVAGMCDAVLAGNRLLADVARRYCEDVRLLPTAVELDDYRIDRSRPPNTPPVIGWIGTPVNLPYLAEALPALDALSRRRRFVLRVVTGDGGEAAGMDFGDVDVEFRQWRAATAVAEIAAFDVGIMPLPDNEWTRYKCGFKLLQYMAAGVPAVGSPVGVNREIIRHAESGFLAASDEAWLRALSELLEDEDLRRRIGRNGRRRVAGHYSVAGMLPVLADALEGR